MAQSKSCLFVPGTMWIAVVVATAQIALMTSPMQAQTFSVLHSFTGGADGAYPIAGVTMAGSETFYGTTYEGGNPDAGVVYRLARVGSEWIVTPIYSFPGGYYGQYPQARVTVGPNGAVFGTTSYGGYYGHGTVFSLKPPPAACSAVVCGWTNTVIYRFLGGNDGGAPQYGDLVFDQAGNVYGTTSGLFAPSTVYELTPQNGGWTENVLYEFQSQNSGLEPYSGVIFDRSGNLYGTTYSGGANQYGTVFRLTPSGSGWTETVLYSFQGSSDGAYPTGGLVFDQSGNLYGTTTGDGYTGNPGSIFELSPTQGGWTFTLIHEFVGPAYAGPVAGLTMDGAGNFCGAALGGAYGYGEVFKLTSDQHGGWTYTNLYDFFGAEDGSMPYGRVLVDTSGNLFGTAQDGGTHGAGVIWEITQ